MPSLVEKILGLPLSAARQREELGRYLRFRDPATMRESINESLSHITQKSGALLAAQAIFIVVDTYGMEHGWPQFAVLTSSLMLVLASLIVMTNLRSTFLASSASVEDPTEMEIEVISKTARLASTRGARFNIALYLTFLSIILLGFGAFESSVG